MKGGLFSGPAGVVAMANAISAYCEKYNLVSDIDRQAVARRVIDIYTKGKNSKSAILSELSRQDGPSQDLDLQSSTAESPHAAHHHA